MMGSAACTLAGTRTSAVVVDCTVWPTVTESGKLVVSVIGICCTPTMGRLQAYVKVLETWAADAVSWEVAMPAVAARAATAPSRAARRRPGRWTRRRRPVGDRSAGATQDG